MLNADRFTVKAQEALSAAHEAAFRAKNTEVLPIHLLSVLVRQEDGIVAPLLRKLGVDMSRIEDGIEEGLGRCPVLDSGQPDTRPSNRFHETLRKAMEEGKSPQEAKLEPEFFQPQNTTVKSNGNDVVMDVEIGEMVKNSLRHQAFTQLLKKKYDGMKAAMEVR